MKMRKAGLCLLMSGMMSFSYGSSFQIWEQDGASVGLYHAGYAAGAMDASTVFYNPAGMSLFTRPQLSIGTAVIHTSFLYTGQVYRKDMILTQTKTVDANGGVTRAVPSIHLLYPLTDKWTAGFSVVAPFGLAVDYGADTFLRYSTVKTSARIVNFTPALSYKINSETSVGAGVDVQYMDAVFTQVVGLGNTLSLDTSSTNDVKGWGYGFHFGLMHHLNPKTRVGISYHSQVKHHLTGTSEFSGSLANANPFAANANQSVISADNAESNITLPAYTAAGVHHQFNDRIALMANAVYTQWSSVDEIRLNNLIARNPMTHRIFLASVGLPKQYRNTFNVSAGGEYAFNDDWTFKAALGFDQTPESTELRDLHSPDNNRFVTALGVNYKWNKDISIDAGWSHFFIRDTGINSPSIDIQDPNAAGANKTLISTKQNGIVQGGADVIGVQVNWSFG